MLTLKALIDALFQLPQLQHHHQLSLQARDQLPVQKVLGEIQTVYNVKILMNALNEFVSQNNFAKIPMAHIFAFGPHVMKVTGGIQIPTFAVILMSVMKEVTHAKLVLRNVSTHREATHVGQNHVQLEEKGILQTLDVALISMSAKQHPVGQRSNALIHLGLISADA